VNDTLTLELPMMPATETRGGCSSAPIGSASVLDMCCGPRMMWYDKNDERAVFLDRRHERHAMNRPKRGTVEWTETAPDILADFTDMPFEDNTFQMVVFDPPHFERSGKIGYLAMKYGWLDGDWRATLRKGFAEGFRVLKPGGTLIFKWTATENPVSEILKLTPMKPLFGHKSGKQAQTHWIAFLKPNDKRSYGAENPKS
jgi:ubiquinone/menaquinone biosynthesis C-methylase UbiE